MSTSITLTFALLLAGADGQGESVLVQPAAPPAIVNLDTTADTLPEDETTAPTTVPPVVTPLQFTAAVDASNGSSRRTKADAQEPETENALPESELKITPRSTDSTADSAAASPESIEQEESGNESDTSNLAPVTKLPATESDVQTSGNRIQVIVGNGAQGTGVSPTAYRGYINTLGDGSSYVGDSAAQSGIIQNEDSKHIHEEMPCESCTDVCGCDTPHKSQHGFWAHHGLPCPWISTGDMTPHIPYLAEPKNYYYLRPYNWFHIEDHQQHVTLYGGDANNPYDNRIFEEVYLEFEQ